MELTQKSPFHSTMVSTWMQYRRESVRDCVCADRAIFVFILPQLIAKGDQGNAGEIQELY